MLGTPHSAGRTAMPEKPPLKQKVISPATLEARAPLSTRWVGP